MRVLQLVAASCVVTAACGWSSTALSQTSAGAGFGLNGESWRAIDTAGNANAQLTGLTKLIYLRGVYDTLLNLHAAQASYDSLPLRVEYSAVIDALDQFYADAANRQILVVDALRLVALRFRGKPSAEFEAATNLQRCRAETRRRLLDRWSERSQAEIVRELQKCFAP